MPLAPGSENSRNPAPAVALVGAAGPVMVIRIAESALAAGAVNLTWDQNTEKDLAGYVVLRGTDLAGRLEPLTPSPIPNSSYTDTVQSGAHFVYAIQAVDRAGNVSQESQRIEETAR